MLNVFPSTGIELPPLAHEAAALDVHDFSERFGSAFFLCTAGAAPSCRVLPIRARVTGAPLVTVGRFESSDICVRDPAVSKHHAFVRVERGRYFIVDAGSARGTTVNGKAVPRRGEGVPVEVTPGAVVCLGGAVKLVLLEAGALYAFVRNAPQSERAANIGAHALPARTVAIARPIDRAERPNDAAARAGAPGWRDSSRAP